MKNEKLMLGLALAIPAAALAVPAPAQKDTRPNIIYIMLDDMPYDMLPHGARYPFLNLPNLERLQREGVTFTNFFCINSLCAPSRATNLTGTYSHINGHTQNVSFLEPDWNKTPPFSVYMQRAGYTTAFIGKIHLAGDSAHRGKGAIRPGFDYWVSIYGQGVYDNPLIDDNGKEVQTKGYVTNIFNRYALNWLEKGRDKSKPFVLCLWEKAVHEPFTPAPKDASLYKNETINPPFYRTDQDDLATKPKYQRVKPVNNNTKIEIPDRIEPHPWHPRPGQWGQMRALAAVDDSLGDILALLEKQGILDNTIILFSSDNGYLHGEHQKGDKRLMYENSIRIPMVIRAPKSALKPGSTINNMCLNLDVAPTLLAFAGIAEPAQMQGLSLKPLLDARADADANWRKSFLYEYYYDNGLRQSRLPDLVGIRGERYKFVENDFLDGKDFGELYDLQTDPGEMNNLYNDPASAQLLDEQRKELAALKAQYGYNPDRNWRVLELDPSFKDTRNDTGPKPPAPKSGAKQRPKK